MSPVFLHLRSGPRASAQEEIFQLILPYSIDGAGWKVAAVSGFLVPPLLPHLTGCGHHGMSLHPTEVAIKS